MSGFFKKLFNRIAGKKEELPPPVAEVKVLPAPEPEAVVELAPEPVVETKPEPKKPEPKAKARPEPKKVEVKKPEPKKPGPKKAEPKKPEPKKPEQKKPEVRKPESKKLEPEKEVPKKVKSSPSPLAGEGGARGARDGRGGLATREVVTAEPIETAPSSPASPDPGSSPGQALLPQGEKGTISKSVVELAPVRVPRPEPAPEPAAERKGWFSRLRDGLSKSSKTITSSITSIFTKRKLDKATLEELEDVLIQADLGLPMAERIIKAVSAGRFDKEIEPEEVKRILAEEVAKVLKPVEVPFNFGSEKPFVILVVGVNGSGKTTTIGKLGAIASREGFKVMFAACDTFRAAAIEQLTIWGQRVGARTISRPTGADSSGLAFDAMKEAGADGTDILFIDTAGRLQNKAYLMDELDKVVRVIKKQDAAAPHAVLLVLDATTGQNAIAQAEVFTKVAGVTGLIMTKLDGTARGGILVAIAEKFKLPVHAIGVGETIDDLQPFEAEAFARAIAGLEDAA